MADSLDGLLDEVEAKFCREISRSQRPSCTFKAGRDSHGHSNSVHSISNSHEAGGMDNNIEAVVQEILDDDYPDSVSHSDSHRPILSESCAVRLCSRIASKKCCPVYLGGSSIASGVGTSVSERACDQLRCTSCDFRVIVFDNQEWDFSCDYLFFRNSMPDCKKLRVKLKRRQGARAYACQCSWHSALTLSELGHIPKLKWVCGQHTAC